MAIWRMAGGHQIVDIGGFAAEGASLRESNKMDQFRARYLNATLEVTHKGEGHVYSFYLNENGGVSLQNYSTNPNAAHSAEYFLDEARAYAERFVKENPPKL